MQWCACVVRYTTAEAKSAPFSPWASRAVAIAVRLAMLPPEAMLPPAAAG